MSPARNVGVRLWVPHWADLALIGIAVAFTALFGTLAVLKHDLLHSTTGDLAIYAQTIWNTAHGRWFETTIVHDEWVSRSHLADHLSLILPVFAPIYLVGGDVRWLLVVQSACFAVAAPIAGRIAQHRLGSPWAAVALGAAILLHPTVTNLNFFDFHPDVLLLPLLLLAFHWFDRDRTIPAAVALGLILLIKESAAMVLVGFGLYAALVRRRWKFGVASVCAGLVWFALAIFVVVPAFGDGRYLHFARYEAEGGPAGVILSIVTPAKIQYALALLLPSGFTAVLGPGPLLAGLPVFAGNLASSSPAQSLLGYQYSLSLVAVTFVAMVEGLARVRRSVAARWGDRAGRIAFSVLIGIALVGASGAFAYRGGIATHVQAGSFRPHPSLGAFREASRLIPPDAGLSASHRAGPHFAERRVLHCVTGSQCLTQPHPTDYVIMLREDIGAAPADRAEMERLLGSTSSYQVIFDQGEVLVLRRAG